MQRLIEGVHRFRTQEFGEYRELFKRLSREGQKPHTLFITCSDSRVIAELITGSRPGELFVVKNVGNIVPPAESTLLNSTGAAIEFAVDVLGVENIVVCGHSQCGAIAAVMGDSADPQRMPRLASWVGLAQPVRQTIAAHYGHLAGDEEKLRAAEEENVLFSLERLQSYECVRRKVEAAEVRLHGWFFKIATGELYAYEPNERQFLPMRSFKEIQP